MLIALAFGGHGTCLNITSKHRVAKCEHPKGDGDWINFPGEAGMTLNQAGLIWYQPGGAGLVFFLTGRGDAVADGILKRGPGQVREQFEQPADEIANMVPPHLLHILCRLHEVHTGGGSNSSRLWWIKSHSQDLRALYARALIDDPEGEAQITRRGLRAIGVEL